PRRTEIVESLRKIDRKSAALNNIKVGLDRKNGYIGTGLKSDDTLLCNEFDHLLCVEKSGRYKIIDLPPDKLFIGKFYECRRHDPAVEFGVIYSDGKSGKFYGKRSTIGSFIKDKEYNLCPDGCKLELLTPRTDAVYTLLSGGRGSQATELNLLTLPVRSPKARGLLISTKKVAKITHLRYLDEAEAAQFRNAVSEEVTEEEVIEVEEQITEIVESDGEVTEIVSVKIEVTESCESTSVTVEPPLPVKVSRPRKTKPEPPVEPTPEPPPVEELMPAPAAPPEPAPPPPKVAKVKKEAAGEPAAPPPSVADEDLGIVQPEFGF
ncbi:MAG: hypothetical protein AB7F32_12410, partial [Victivallaceae bacterium]